MAAGRRTRILIVDDSAVMRSLLRSVVCADASLEVAGTAADGASALAGIEMPAPGPDSAGCGDAGDGRLGRPCRIARAGTQDAGDHVQFAHPARRQSDHRGAGLRRFRLCGQASRTGQPRGSHAGAGPGPAPKIHALTSQIQCPPQAQTPPALAAVARQPLRSDPGAACARPQPISSAPAVLAIGVSTGGPAALDVLLPALPGNFPLPVLVVQHMPELFTGLFAERLNGRCRLQVREAAEGDPVRAGTIYIARGNWHMEVLAALRAGSPPTLHLNQGPQENHCRPAVDVLFRSAGRSLWRGCAGGGAHRHGFRRIDGLPHHSRSRRQRAGPGPGHQHGVGNARRGGPCRTGAQVFFRSTSWPRKSSASSTQSPPRRVEARELLKSVV